MKFAVQPVSDFEDSPMPAVVVDLENPTSTDNVTMSLGTNPASGTLSGTLTVAAVGGFATFTDLEINNPGVGYTLVATAPEQRNPTNPPKGFMNGVNGVRPSGLGTFQAGYYYNFPPCGTIYSHNTVSDGEIHPNLNPTPVTVSVTSNPFTVFLD